MLNVFSFNVSHDHRDFCMIEQEPLGQSDLVHLVIKIVAEKADSEKIFMLVTFLWYINFSVSFLKRPQKRLKS